MSPKFKTFQVLALILCHRDWDFCAFLWYKSSTEQKRIYFLNKNLFVSYQKDSSSISSQEQMVRRDST